MSSLNPDDLHRLIGARRKLLITATVACVAALAVVVLLVPNGVPVPVGATIGVGIGALALLPYRRVLNELGLDRREADAILNAEKERRKGTTRSQG